ncbi:MAG: acetyl-CoA carboxylase biotin carboxylase subunit, partial [Candidatus Binataceae bacterium]
AASREALAAFGDGRVFVEKYLARPRHVEVQFLGDEHGTIVTMGERDCSIQRRHQKIVEESPAPGLSAPTRDAMLAAATRLAQSAGYTNAGTAEFLVEGDKFYFLEVNARLQVEHPITEIRFGCDLVAEQIKIARGEKIADPGAPRGHAIECRINAEDAAAGFRPATGTVLELRVPAGPGVRFDSHLTRGTTVGAYYDGLLGKLVTHGSDREQARARMLGALDELAILGVTNTAGFLRDVIASDAFARADLSTRFIEEHFPVWPGQGHAATDAALIGAALTTVGALGANSGASPASAPTSSADLSPWTALRGFELWRRP